MNLLHKANDFLNFARQSTRIENIKDDLLQQFCLKIMQNIDYQEDFQLLESIRTDLLRNESELEIVEFGAGSSFGNKPYKRIKDIAKQQLSNPYQLQLLYHMIRYNDSKHIIELGASLGLSSLYLAKAAPKGMVNSFEGNPHFITFIKEQMHAQQVKNINLIPGNFDTTLIDFCKQKQRIDFAFIDGNHRSKPTIQYFEAILPHLHEKSIVVFDDIHWSKDMYQAWQTIQKHPKVQVSLDMYVMGIILFDQELFEKNHLKIRPRTWKNLV